MGPNYYVTPPAASAGGPSRKMLLLGGGLLAAVFLGIILMLSSGGKNISTQAQHLVLRLSALQAILDDTATTRNLKNQDLGKIVTDSSLSLQSDTNAILPLLAKDLPAKYDQSILNSETDLTTPKKLEEAGLNNHLDEVYAEVLLEKIISIRALLAEMIPLTGGELKVELQNLDKHILDQGKKIQELKL